MAANASMYRTARDFGPATPDHSRPAMGTAVPDEGGHTNPDGNLLPGEDAQLWQFGQQGQRHLFSHARNGDQQVVFPPPTRTLEYLLTQAAVQADFSHAVWSRIRGRASGEARLRRFLSAASMSVI